MIKLAVLFVAVTASCIPSSVFANQQPIEKPSESSRVMLANGVAMAKREGDLSDDTSPAVSKVSNDKLKVILQLTKSPLVRFSPTQQLTKKSQALFAKAITTQQQAIAGEQQQVVSSLKKLGLDKQVVRSFSHLYNGLALEIAPQQLHALSKISGVKKVHVVEDRKLLLDTSVPLIGADQVWQLQDANDAEITGKGVKVAVIDTGVDYTREELGGCFGENCRVYGGYDFINDDDDPIDDQGHGTHVAGIIGAQGATQGVAPDVKFVAYKVCDYYCPTEHIIAALEKAVDPDGDPLTNDGVDIVNISIGGGFALDNPLTVAVDELAKKGTLVVISAGNEGEGERQFTVTSPGNARHALTVASTTKYDEMSSFSSRGPLLTDQYQKPEIAAPGSDIYSLAIGEGLVSLSGTSMAAPHVAGAAALVKQKHPDLDGQQIKSLLVANTDDIGQEFFAAGAGRLNVLKAAQAQVLPGKSYLLFERLDRSAKEVELQTTLELTNVTQQEVTVNLDFGKKTAGIDYSVLEGAELTFSAGQVQSITISLKIDTESLAYPDALLQRKNLTISNSAFSSTVPVLIFDAIKFDWSADQYTDSVWLHNRDSGKSRTINYQESGSEYLLPGNYFFSSFVNYGDSYAVVVKELSDVKQDTQVSITKADAIHKIQLDGFTDHQGNNKTLDNLYGGGTYVEVAYPDNLDRQFHFWSWQDSGYFTRYPVYVSELPLGLEFNFSLMAGDKSTPSEDYHTYVHTESLTEISGDISFSLDGTADKKVAFNVPVNAYSDEKMSWRLRNNLWIDPYRWPQGWTRYAYTLEGPSSWMNSDQADVINGEFTVTLHGNEFSNQRFGYYDLLVGEFSKGYESGVIRFEQQGAYSLYKHDLMLLDSTKHVELSSYRLAGEGIFPQASIFWQDEYILFDTWLFGANNSRIGNDHIKHWLLVCDDLVVKSVSQSNFYDDTPNVWQCDKKRIEQGFSNYLYGRKQLANFVAVPNNSTQIYQIELSSEANNNAEAVDVIDISLGIKHTGVSTDNLTAWVNTSGQWQQLDVALLSSQTEEWPYNARYRLALPRVDETSLASIKIQFDDGSDFWLLTQPNAYLLGGSKEELATLDNDNDGISDLEDMDRDNDGIPDDVEILNGLNHFDASDATGDKDGDGISNLDEYNQGRFISYLEDDRDGDGVADHKDAFPDDPAESQDTDGDGIGNNTDTDDDNDGVEDSLDAFPFDESESVDTDNDGIGNNADMDDDNDGVEDVIDLYPLDPEEAFDHDNDGIGDNADTDDDNDGVEDSLDAFPFDESESVDTDNDGIGNNVDSDDDNDGVEDQNDAFPLDASESVDTDNDGTGNNADTDDDNDGVLDSSDAYPLDASRSSQAGTNNGTNSSSSSSGGSGGSFGYLAILLLANLYRRKLRVA